MVSAVEATAGAATNATAASPAHQAAAAAAEAAAEAASRMAGGGPEAAGATAEGAMAKGAAAVLEWADRTLRYLNNSTPFKETVLLALVVTPSGALWRCSMLHLPPANCDCSAVGRCVCDRSRCDRRRSQQVHTMMQECWLCCSSLYLISYNCSSPMCSAAPYRVTPSLPPGPSPYSGIGSPAFFLCPAPNPIHPVFHDTLKLQLQAPTWGRGWCFLGDACCSQGHP